MYHIGLISGTSMDAVDAALVEFNEKAVLKFYNEYPIESSLKKFGINFLYKKLQNIDNLYAQKISPNDKQRIVRAIEVKTSTGKSILERQKNSRKKIFKKILYIVIKTDKEVLYSRINKRCQEMINL